MIVQCVISSMARSIHCGQIPEIHAFATYAEHYLSPGNNTCRDLVTHVGSHGALSDAACRLKSRRAVQRNALAVPAALPQAAATAAGSNALTVSVRLRAPLQPRALIPSL